MKIGNLIVGVLGAGLVAWVGTLSWSMRATKRELVTTQNRVADLEKRVAALHVESRGSRTAAGFAAGAQFRSSKIDEPATQGQAETNQPNPDGGAQRKPVATSELEKNFATSHAYEAVKRCLVQLAPNEEFARVYFKVDKMGAVSGVAVGPMDDAVLRDCIVHAAQSWKTRSGPAMGLVTVYPD